jgi:hypothetical protein
MPDTRLVIPSARRESTDIGERFIWAALGVVLGVLVLCGLLVSWLYPQSRLDRTLSLPLPVYPAPRLQPSPPEDLKKFRAAELRTLEGTGWVDKTHGIVHVPISEAMRLVAQEGIPGWPVTRAAARSAQTP